MVLPTTPHVKELGTSSPVGYVICEVLVKGEAYPNYLVSLMTDARCRRGTADTRIGELSCAREYQWLKYTGIPYYPNPIVSWEHSRYRVYTAV